jgi:phosphoserine phosphatase
VQTILTLIGAPGALSTDHVATVRQRLGEVDIITRTEVDWLAPEEACDVLLPDPLPPDIPLDMVRNIAIIALASALAPIDAVIQRTAHRRKRLLVADMDSTIITCECIDELADAVGLKAKVSAITERAMRGEIAFEPALRERVALLKGLPMSALDDVFRSRVRLTPGAKTLVATMSAHGAKSALVSGGFTFFTSRVAELCGFGFQQANVLEIAGGRLTGRIAEPILGRQAKLAALLSQAKARGIKPAETLAIGDGANDLEMIAAAGLGVAFHAKPKVIEAAPAAIVHSDLSAVLYVQGYRRSEFVL